MALSSVPVHAVGFDRTSHVRQPGGHSPNPHAPGYLGIGYRDLPAEQLAGLNLKGTQPIEVILVDHDAPAGKAGFRPHDIIVALNGQAVAGAQAFTHLIHDSGAGFAVIINVLRDGHPMTFNTKLVDREALERETLAHLSSQPSDQPSPASADVATPVDAAAPPPAVETGKPHSQGFINSVLHNGNSYTGLTCDRMEPQLAGYFGSPAGMGLLVHVVDPGSPAAVAGVHAGDVILRADGQPIKTSSDWTKHVHNAKGRAISVTILRDRHESTLSLQPGLKHHSLLEWPRVF